MAKRGRVSVKQLTAVLVAAAQQVGDPRLAEQAKKVIDGYNRGDLLILESEMPL